MVMNGMRIAVAVVSLDCVIKKYANCMIFVCFTNPFLRVV